MPELLINSFEGGCDNCAGTVLLKRDIVRGNYIYMCKHCGAYSYGKSIEHARRMFILATNYDWHSLKV